MLVTEVNLTYLEKTVKHVTITCITTNWDIIVSANIISQPINKAQLDRLEITITKPFGDLI